MRTLERTLEEVLLPALDTASARSNGEAELEYACRWATGWLHGARRLAPPSSRPQGVLLLDSGPALEPGGRPRPGARALPAQGRPSRSPPVRRPRRAPLLDSACAPSTPSPSSSAAPRLALTSSASRSAARCAHPAPRPSRTAPRSSSAARDGMPSLGSRPGDAATLLIAALDLAVALSGQTPRWTWLHSAIRSPCARCAGSVP